MGKVYLVGAGPGRADLITVRGLRLIREADAVIYDRLIDMDVLNEARDGCELIEAGKRMGQHSMSQSEINDVIIDAARRHDTVVRLKGGDPFIFGRGGEEAMALIAAGVDFEAVPGVTSASAVPAHAGIPVTHRGVSRSFHVITGHTKGDELDYGKYSDLDGTLVFLMGLNKINKITGDLMAGGMDGDIPSAVISDGFGDDERIVRGTLSEIARKTEEAGIKAPAVIVVGQTALFDLRPLPHDCKDEPVIYTVGTDRFVTRLEKELVKRGLKSERLIEIRLEQSEEGRTSLREALGNIKDYSIITFASQNAAGMFFDLAAESGLTAGDFEGIRFAAIGRATEEAVAEHGFAADIVPAEATGDALGEAIAGCGCRGKVLTIRAEAGSDSIYRILDSAGISYERIVLYRAVKGRGPVSVMPAAKDIVALASASGARIYFEAAGSSDGTDGLPRFACIGDYTAKEVHKHCAAMSGSPARLTVSSAHSAAGLAEDIARRICEERC